MKNTKFMNPSDEDIEKILRNYKIIAVVGLSANNAKPSYMVAEYLQNMGYRIIPVNPNATEILGEKCYPDLKSIPEEIDIIDIFRKPEDVMPIVDEALDTKAKVIWMQSGIINEDAAKKAKNAKLEVVMDRCIKVERSLI